MRKTWIAVSLLTAALSHGASAEAQSPFNPQASMHDNLAAVLATKKQVTVVLKNGDKYQANVGSLGDHLVVLTQPVQKEFFDVLVAIDEISALEVRAR